MRTQDQGLNHHPHEDLLNGTRHGTRNVRGKGPRHGPRDDAPGTPSHRLTAADLQRAQDPGPQSAALSAARLAAEAAFAPAPVLAAAAPVQVRIVVARRRRLQSADVQAPPAAPVAQLPASKTPRVFRLGDDGKDNGKGNGKDGGKDKDADRQGDMDLAKGDRTARPAAASPQSPGGAQPPARRRRKDKATERPGPVVLVAVAPARAAPRPATADGPPTPQPQELEALRRMLAELEPTFAQIRFAQAFRLDLTDLH